MAEIPKPAAGLKFLNQVPKSKAQPEIASVSKSREFAGIKIKDAVPVLLAEKSDIPGHQDVLSAGLCAWVLRPRDTPFIAHVMVAEAARWAARRDAIIAEDEGVLVAAPAQAKYRHLFKRIFYPVGGILALVRAYHGAGDRNAHRTKSERELRYLVALVSVLHAFVEFRKNEKQQQPVPFTIEGANRLIASFDLLVSYRKGKAKKKVSIEQVRRYWISHSRSLALAYSASLIAYSENRTILDAIFANRVSGAKLRKLMPEWFANAEYVRINVLEKTKFGRKKIPGEKGISSSSITKPRFEALPDIDAKPPQPPVFDAKQLEAIIAEFS